MTFARRPGWARWKPAALSVLAALALAACGGGGDGSGRMAGGGDIIAKSAASTAASPSMAAHKAAAEALVNPAGTRSFIVLLKDDVVGTQAMAQASASAHGGKVLYTYTSAVNGFAVRVPESKADDYVDALQSDPAVALIEPDQPVYADQSVQLNPPWGLDRIDQRDLPLNQRYLYNATGSGVRAYIVDTGIYAGHSDFGGRVLPGFTAINDGRGTSDCDGHGTHVAGTVGGNTWGVAKQVALVPVRVLGCSGTGSTSGVIAGVDWITANAPRPAVANMSLGGGASSAMDAAIARATARGITMAVSAGNSNTNACNQSPARAPSALTVGATDMNDRRASFSNYGTCLDIFAPGVNIRSASISSPTASTVMSGTSMASPHVAGVAALYLETQPGASAAQVEQFIKTSATPNKVVNPGPGSPNLLLYSLGEDDGPPPPPPTMMVSVRDLDGESLRMRNHWRALVTIAVRNAHGEPVTGAVVEGIFRTSSSHYDTDHGGGTRVSCTTDEEGTCQVRSGLISNRTHSVRYRVEDISGPGMTYVPEDNEETWIRIRR